MKRANTMMTFECCVTSPAKKLIIVEESTKRALMREKVCVTAVKQGKILTKSSNVQNHVMQSKHAWDKVAKLGGNVEEDFKKVVAFLEEK